LSKRGLAGTGWAAKNMKRGSGLFGVFKIILKVLVIFF